MLYAFGVQIMLYAKINNSIGKGIKHSIKNLEFNT